MLLEIISKILEFLTSLFRIRMHFNLTYSPVRDSRLAKLPEGEILEKSPYPEEELTTVCKELGGPSPGGGGGGELD